MTIVDDIKFQEEVVGVIAISELQTRTEAAMRRSQQFQCVDKKDSFLRVRVRRSLLATMQSLYWNKSIGFDYLLWHHTLLF
jgi:hypothetical protein